MQAVKSFDKKNLQSLRAEMNELLKKYGATINLDVEVGNMKFSAAEVEIKIKAKVIGATTMSESMLSTYMKLDGIAGTAGRDGEKLLEHNSRRWKRPYTYADKNGKRYVCDAKYAKYLFGSI